MSQEDFRAALDRRDERAAERLDKLMGRIDQRFDRMEAKFELRQDASDKDVHREFGEQRRDLGELRDLLGIHSRKISEMETHREAQMGAAAEGAARGAGDAAGRAAAATAKVTAGVAAAGAARGFWSSKVGKLVTVSVGISAVGAAIEGIPKIAAWIVGLFQYLAGHPK